MSNLTKSQEELADLLLNTKIEAKVIKRKQKEDGSFFLEEGKRDTSPIDFAQTEEEFALKIHEVNINAPLSPIYVNLRNLPENVLKKIGEVLAEVKLDTPQEFCTGVPKAALVIAQGKSKLEALEAAKTVGFYVNMLVLIDREQGGIEQVEKEGCKVYAAIKLTDVLNYYIEKNMITKEQFEKSMEYLKPHD